MIGEEAALKLSGRLHAATVAGLDRAGLRDKARQLRALRHLLSGGQLREEVRLKRGLRDPSPIPPGRLTYLTHSSLSGVLYHEGGRTAAEFIRSVLVDAGMKVAPDTRVLDFGCGAGAVLRWWGGDVYAQGSDIVPELVGWCAANLGVPVGLNQLEPPTVYPNDEFDAMYAMSVMTHLRPELQMAWMREWIRIVRPGGLILASFHGASHLPPESSESDLEQQGCITVWSERSGSNLCTAWNSEADVRERLGADLHVVWSRTSQPSTNDQDIYIFRVPE